MTIKFLELLVLAKCKKGCQTFWHVSSVTGFQPVACSLLGEPEKIIPEFLKLEPAASLSAADTFYYACHRKHKEMEIHHKSQISANTDPGFQACVGVVLVTTSLLVWCNGRFTCNLKHVCRVLWWESILAPAQNIASWVPVPNIFSDELWPRNLSAVFWQLFREWSGFDCMQVQSCPLGWGRVVELSLVTVFAWGLGRLVCRSKRSTYVWTSSAADQC